MQIKSFAFQSLNERRSTRIPIHLRARSELIIKIKEDVLLKKSQKNPDVNDEEAEWVVNRNERTLS